MLDYFLNKQVTVFRKDGNVLQGCILEIKDGFIRMVEPNNKMIVFNNDCVDLIREGIFLTEESTDKEQTFVFKKFPKSEKVSKIKEPQEFVEEEDYEERTYASFNDDFSMSMSTPTEDSLYKTPTFIRTMPKE